MNTSEQYSTREIDDKFNGLEEILSLKLDSIHDVAVETRDQARATNGRVNKLEVWRAKIEGGAAVSKGIWGIVGTFVIAGVFSLFSMYSTIQEIDSRIVNEDQAVKEKIEEYFAQYDIEFVVE